MLFCAKSQCMELQFLVCTGPKHMSLWCAHREEACVFPHQDELPLSSPAIARRDAARSRARNTCHHVCKLFIIIPQKKKRQRIRLLHWDNETSRCAAASQPSAQTQGVVGRNFGRKLGGSWARCGVLHVLVGRLEVRFGFPVELTAGRLLAAR